jgi:hypothetical protein
MEKFAIPSVKEYICAGTLLWLRLWSAHHIMQNDAIKPQFCGSIGIFGLEMVRIIFIG